jgi:hypothetical protein
VSVLGGIALGLLAVLAFLFAVTPVFDGVRRRALRRIVRQAAATLDANGVDYWCDFGTLLGLHREGDIIRGDKDADFCVLESEKPRLLAAAPALDAAGLRLADIREGRLVRIHDRATPYYVDVYILRPRGTMLESLLNHPQEDVPEHLVRPPAFADFLGTTLRVPPDIPALLRYRYGERYMVPRRNDKGASRPFNRVRSLAEDVEYNCIGLWGVCMAFRAAFKDRGGALP